MCLYFNLFNGWPFRKKKKSCSEEQKAKQAERRKLIKIDKAREGNGEKKRNFYETNLILNSDDFKFDESERKSVKHSDEMQSNVDESSREEQRLDGVDASQSTLSSPSDNKTPESQSIATTAAADHRVEFKIRTRDRQHLDFDGPFELDNVRAENRSKWAGPFHFVQAADSQFGMIDSFVHHKQEPGWKEEIELCEKLIDTCNRMKPKPEFLIICGDLVDAWPATETRRQQVVDFKRVFAKLNCNIPLVCVCGNHDVGDRPTVASVQEYRQNFGDDYFYFTKNDVLFIVINSQFYQHREFVQDYARDQDEWLEVLLAKCKLFKYSIVFQHIPWFLQNPEEEDDYFNVKKEVRLKWLRKFKLAGVTKIMCGHYHRNAGGWFEDMELVVTSAIGAQCGQDQSGVRIVRVLEESIEHQYYAMPDIPLQIDLN